MDTDERFKHLASDPRFKILRKRQHKVKIDDRFKSMFTDERFTLKYSKDKRGRNQKKTSGDDLKRYYSLGDDCSSNNKEKYLRDQEENVEDDVPYRSNQANISSAGEVEEVEDEVAKEAEDEDEVEDEQSITEGNSEEDEIEDEDDEHDEDGSDSEFSTSSDEPESDFDDETNDPKGINYERQPLDADAEKAEFTTHRLAIQNLDWDHMDVRDIYILVNSIRPPLSVRIYVSEFGKERLKKEEAEGPKELIETSKEEEEEEELKQLENKMRVLQEQKTFGKKYRNNEYEDADEALDPKDEKIRERIRAYQLNRMKYYYSIIEFDSIESAEAVYNELDGIEYEGSSLAIDLRFVPDDIDFDSENLKAICDQIPDPSSYKSPMFINSALQQTTVKLTWDETDIKRQEKLQRAYTKGELEKDDLEAYLASETETESEIEEEEEDQDKVSVVTAKSEARAKKYEMLLKSLEEKEQKKKKIDVDIEWSHFEGNDEANDGHGGNPSSDEEDTDDNEHTEFPDESIKLKRKSGLRKRKRSNNDYANDNDANDEDLNLLLMDVNSGRKDEFKFDPDDARFEAIYKSGLYNIDPSHPKFKQTEAFEQIAKKKRDKRRKISH